MRWISLRGYHGLFKSPPYVRIHQIFKITALCLDWVYEEIWNHSGLNNLLIRLMKQSYIKEILHYRTCHWKFCILYIDSITAEYFINFLINGHLDLSYSGNRRTRINMVRSKDYCTVTGYHPTIVKRRWSMKERL